MRQAGIENGAPPFEAAFELLQRVVDGVHVSPDEPLTTTAVESLDIVEWIALIEEELGYDVPDLALVGVDDLDLEATPRDVYAWLVGRAGSGHQSG